MQFTSAQLKYAARYKIKKSGLRSILATLILLVILTAMGLLALRLIGYIDYVFAVYGEFVEVLAEDYGALRGNMDSPTELYGIMFEALFKAMEGVPEWTIPPVGGILAAAVGMMMLVFLAGHTYFCYRISREEKPRYRDLTAGFSCMGKLVGIWIFRIAATLLGLFLFVLPGILIWYRCRNAVFVLCEHPEYTAMQCIRESLRIGGAGKLIMLDLSFIGWHILNYVLMAILLTPIVFLWIVPYMQVARAEFYNRGVRWTPALKREDETEENTEE